jgi:hypothetical protein
MVKDRRRFQRQSFAIMKNPLADAMSAGQGPALAVTGHAWRSFTAQLKVGTHHLA